MKKTPRETAKRSPIVGKRSAIAIAAGTPIVALSLYASFKFIPPLLERMQSPSKPAFERLLDPEKGFRDRPSTDAKPFGRAANGDNVPFARPGDRDLKTKMNALDLFDKADDLAEKSRATARREICTMRSRRCSRPSSRALTIVTP